MLSFLPATRVSIRLVRISVVALLVLGIARACHAQADATLRKKAEISAFGGFLGLSTDAGGSSLDKGGTLGIAYSRFFVSSPLVPTIEARANVASGPYANEKSYLVGGRLGGQIGRYRPYVDYLFGKGTVHYNTRSVYVGDASAVYDYGFGIDIDLQRNFQFKLDYQTQSWQTNPNTFFYPSGLLIGVSYRIPFRRYVSERDVH